MRLVSICLVVFCLCAPAARAGQSGAASAAGAAGNIDPVVPAAFDGPPPPAPPQLIARDAAGRATVRAVRLNAPLRIDGRLDEALYRDVPPISDFVQMEPQFGALATEKTEVWVAFDRDQVYVSFRCWESQPLRVVANEMRRDSTAIWNGDDIVSVIFDTFYDRRNSIQFNVNSIGGRQDAQVNDGRWNGDWNPIWEVKVGRFEGGWTVEAAIPFKSLRYGPGRSQVWGFNVFRTNRWKNELSYLLPMPKGRGQQAILQSSLAATLVGIQAPAAAKNFEIKPYATSNLTSDLKANPAVSNELGKDFGIDAKVGLTRNLTTDLTYNTDFSQVEADEQQINLTRFSLFFPEKREFFLENQGTFSFGGVAVNGAGDTPILFYSRKIGLNQGTPIRIDGGGRLTGRVGRYTLGALNIETGDEATSGTRPTNFSVVRLRRDLLGRSSVGVIFTGRSVGQTGADRNVAYGLDGTFGFFSNLTINTYWARTDTRGASGKDTSYRAQMDYSGDRYGVQLEQLAVGDSFNPEVGFVRRSDIRKSFALFRFSPRPRSIKAVRKFSWTGATNYIENGSGRVESRNVDGEFAIEFQTGDRFAVGATHTHEYVPRPSLIASVVTIPTGAYGYNNLRIGMNIGRQRKITGNLLAEYGTFYSGYRTALTVSQGRVNVTHQLSLEPTFSVNWLNLEPDSFTTELLGSRVTYTMTPLMFASALMQYNSATHGVSANVRFRWEYRPGSELFVVYNEQRDTLVPSFPELSNRAVIVKINTLVRF